MVGGTGNVTIGVRATWRTVWHLEVRATDFIGSATVQPPSRPLLKEFGHLLLQLAGGGTWDALLADGRPSRSCGAIRPVSPLRTETIAAQAKIFDGSHGYPSQRVRPDVGRLFRLP
jgi:hypothetical protein